MTPTGELDDSPSPDTPPPGARPRDDAYEQWIDMHLAARLDEAVTVDDPNDFFTTLDDLLAELGLSHLLDKPST